MCDSVWVGVGGGGESVCGMWVCVCGGESVFVGCVCLGQDVCVCVSVCEGDVVWSIVKGKKEGGET